MSTNLQNIWRQSDAVCFDFDSTLIQEESINELATFCGRAEDVINLTSEAMSGKLSIRESLERSLNIIQPSLSQIRSFIQTRPPTLTPGIKELIQELHTNQVPVYVISGGFYSIIEPIAKALNIPDRNVFANKLKFFYNGDYAGFDETAYTSKNGGKAIAIDLLKQTHKYKNVVHVGDGITDLEALTSADAVVGFGGNVVREKVKAGTQWFIMSFDELINVLA